MNQHNIERHCEDMHRVLCDHAQEHRNAPKSLLSIFSRAHRYEEEKNTMERASFSANIIRKLMHAQPCPKDEWFPEERITRHTAFLISDMRKLSIPSAYINSQEQVQHETIKSLLEDKQIANTAQNWKIMPENLKAPFMRSVTRLQYKIFFQHLSAAVPPIMFDLFHAPPPRENKPAPYFKQGEHYQTPQGHTVRINNHEKSVFSSFLGSMNILHHEVYHSIQGSLAHLHENNALKPSEPLYKSCRFWHDVFRNSFYIPKIRSTYIYHPMEQDSFLQGKIFAQNLREGLKEKGVTLEEPEYVPSLERHHKELQKILPPTHPALL